MRGVRFGRARTAFIRAISGPSSAVNFRLVARPDQAEAHIRRKLGGAQVMRRGFRRKTGLAEKLAEERMGFRVLRMRLDRSARRGKSFVEGARGLQGARFGDPGHSRPRSSRGRGAECGRGLGVRAASDRASPSRIWAATRSGFSATAASIARHRLALLAQAVEDIGEIVVRARKAGVEAESGGEWLDRLFQTPCGHHRDAEVMV